MIRKLQQSRRLHFVSLPNEWVRQYNLKQGSSLEVNEAGSELIIRPQELMNFKKIEVITSCNKVKALAQLIRSCFISGATEATIKLKEKLSEDKVKELRREIKNFYGINSIDISSSAIKIIIVNQISDIKELSKMIFNSVINALRAAISNDKEMVDSHVEQTQLYRHVIRRFVNVTRKNLNWNTISESLGVISHIIQQEYSEENKKFFEKILLFLQKLEVPDLTLDDCLKIYDDVLELKNLISPKNKNYNKLDRAYTSLFNLVRELINEKLE